MGAVEELATTSGMLPVDSDPALLNASAFARKLHPAVEARLKRPVQIATITVCLTRLIAQGKLRTMALPQVRLDTFSIQSGLVELSYHKTTQALAAIKKLYQVEASFSSHKFFTVTYGMNEVSIIADRDMIPAIQEAFAGQDPKMTATNLGCLYVQFDKNYLAVPNVMFVIMRSLAAGNVNIVEVVSTFTELVFVLDEADLQKALALLQAQFTTRT